ncbi:fec operon regulator FecR [compost metagenome]
MRQPRPSEAEHATITDAAAHWCMRLQEPDCTPAERAGFEQWLKADPRHGAEYEAMLDIWEVTGQLQANLTAPTVALLPPTCPRHWRNFAVAAAVALMTLPLAGVIAWNLGHLPSSWQSFEAGDQVRKVTLADGSQVELNIGTRLTYADYKDQRRVTLKNGEAFFDVSHAQDHPFVVRAAGGQIRVTGTQFNVWLYDDQVRVTLLRGSVLVSSGACRETGYRLDPGMQASYARTDPEPRLSQTHADDPSLAWRDGKLVLNNLALADALPLINRYLQTPVLLADEHVGAIRIGGIFNTSNVKGLVRSLPEVLPVYLTQNDQGNLLINAVPQRKSKY